MRYAALTLILLAGTANADTFRCVTGTIYSQTTTPAVIAEINEDGKTGEIKVAGTAHQTRYYVDGFNRRWDFGLRDDGMYQYSFILKPDGSASYVDFKGAKKDATSAPSQIFACKQVS